MKKALFLLLAGLSAAGAALASPPPAANVNFTSERGVPFAVVLDGRPLTRGLARQVHTERLVPGLHYADFSVPTLYGGLVHLRCRVWLEPGLETSFVLLARPRRPLDLRQVDAVTLYGPGCEPGYGPARGGHHDHSYDTNPARDRSYGDGGAYPADPYGSRPHQLQPHGQSGYGQGQLAPDGTFGLPGGAYAPNQDYNVPVGGGRYYAGAAGSYLLMTSPDVAGLTQALDRCPFEEERLRIARQALSQSSIRADDLALLLKGFRFDDSRVEFAKFAYAHVADRQNFYRVYPSFEFSSHAREVQDAIAQPLP